MTSTVQTSVCKSLQSIGLSPRKEHQIENAIAIQLESSGPEFLLSRMSDLNDWRKMHMSGDTQYHPQWHAYKNHNGACVPTDPIGSNLWGLKDKAFFAAVGCIRKSVELAVPTEKQLSKWLDGVRCENTSSKGQVLGFKANTKCLDQLEKSIVSKWSSREWFNVSDITGTNIPGSGKFMNVKVDKTTNTKEPLSLLSAYGFSVNTAPLFIWQFLKDIDAPSRMGESIDNPEEFITSLSEVITNKLSDEIINDEALMGSSFIDDETFLMSREYINPNFGFLASVGNIGFLEQPGGKLRTVANPNRLVQWCNIPLGEALAEYFYKYSGCYVKDQEGGMRWAQRKLQEGVCLSSFDMSAATDRLDYRKFLHEYFSRAYESEGQYPMLVRSLELFEDTSSSNWNIPGHIADLLNMPDNQIGWKVGQPLGLRPSFPILQIMNSKCAESAIYAVDGSFSTGHYACVGDDLIIETRYAEAYMDRIRAFNGKINNDKTMQSDRYAEFCSQMITKSGHYPLKPRFIHELDGSFQNIEKFSTTGLHPKVPKWTKELHSSVSMYHLDGFNTIRYQNSSTPKSLLERVGVNTLIEAIKPAVRDHEKVTLQTLYMRAEEQLDKQGAMPPAKDLSTSYADDAYPKFGGSNAKPNVKDSYISSTSRVDYDILGAVSTDGSTSVELPIKEIWDYKQARYTRPASEVSTLKDTKRIIEKIDTTVVGSMVESEIVVQGVKTSTFVDMSEDNPEIEIRHQVPSPTFSSVKQKLEKVSQQTSSNEKKRVRSCSQKVNTSKLGYAKEYYDNRELDDCSEYIDDDYDRDC